MDGLEFVSAVREAGLTEAPIMMVTTESSLESIQDALQRGAQEFLMKPFDEDMIRDKLSLLGFELPA